MNIRELRRQKERVVATGIMRCPCGQSAVGYGIVRAQRAYFPICAQHKQEMLTLGEMAEDDFVTLREEADFLVRYQQRCTCEWCRRVDGGH